MEVLQAWCYPVKSLRGDACERAAVGALGLGGDRQWGLRDVASGRILTARRAPALLFGRGAIVDGQAVVELPDGTRTADDRRLSDWIGRPVELVRAHPERRGEYEIAVDGDGDHQTAPDAESGEWHGRWASWEGPEGVFHDSRRTRVSLLGTASLGDWPVERFRPNIVVDGDERDLLGRRIRIGDTVLSVGEEIDRCVVVTRPQPGLDRDISVLRSVLSARAGNLGVGAMVTQPGHVAVGDAVEVID